MNVFERFNSVHLLGFVCLFALLISSCNDPSSLGSELLDEDLLEVEYTDTFTVIATTIEGTDSILVYDETTLTNDLFAGEIQDPFFGSETYDAFFLPGLGATIPSFYDYDNNQFATVDSVVLIVNVDTSLYYGNTDATHSVDVFMLQDEVDFDGTYYSDQDFETLMTPIAENEEFKLKFEAFGVSFNGDTTLTAPSIRLKLDNSVGEALVMDTSAVKNDTLIREVVPGFKIVNRANETAVLPLDLSTKTLIDKGNKLYIYYTDTVPSFYAFPLGGVRHIYQESDISGSDLETAINTPSTGEELVYIKGYGGADIKLEFPTARFEALGDVLLKKAELEVTVAPQTGDDDEIYPPMQLIYIDQEDPDTGERERVIDLVNASIGATIESGFGGVLRQELDDNDEVIRSFYTFNLTSYFQSLLEENTEETGVLYLEAASPELIIGRSILYGTESDTYPLKLKMTYSIPN